MNLYTLTIPQFERTLCNLDLILGKAQAWAESKKISDETLLKARLSLDMFPLSRQVQAVCDGAKNTAARLTGKDIVKMEDNESTLSELRARIAKTLEILSSFTQEDFNDAEARVIAMPYHQGKAMTGLDYTLEYALPNFYFHMVTAYDILRHYGLDIGKADFLGALSLKDL